MSVSTASIPRPPVSYEEEDTCVSYEEEDTYVSLYSQHTKTTFMVEGLALRV